MARKNSRTRPVFILIVFDWQEAQNQLHRQQQPKLPRGRWAKVLVNG
jgi:hypothetical protein